VSRGVKRVAIRRRLNTAWKIFHSFHGVKGKVYAMFIILLEATKLAARRLDIRLPLPRKLNYLSKTIGLTNLSALEERMKPLNVMVCADEPIRINVLLPALVPELIFGGYISVLNFIQKLIISGYQVRIIICEEVSDSAEKVRKNCKTSKVADAVLCKVELLVARDRSEGIPANKSDVFIGYSWLTMRLASFAAKRTNDKLPLFFIQEFEAIFHPHDSFHALCIETYGLPHFSIFNSELLKKFFEQKGLGVFDPLNPVFGNEYKYAFFSHAISNIKPPNGEELANRKTKKLLFYARPEAHAARNIFEISMLGLKEAIESGVFSSEWEFYGIGSLALADELKLTNDTSLKMFPRVTLEEYCKMLGDFDIGLSLMYSPHPSVPPFEMAAAGMLTVTSSFENRLFSDIEVISSNLIATRPTPSSVASGLRQAVKRTDNVDDRLKGAKFEWPRSWDESFNEEFLKLLADKLPYIVRK
jgi:beta-1,2-rhamnosyltransferase WsaF-like protein